MGIENIEVLKSERPMKRIFVFANDETRASLYGLKINQVPTKLSPQIFHFRFNRAEGLILERGDWVQIIQEFGEQDAERCVDRLVNNALQQGYILKVMDINTFEVCEQKRPEPMGKIF